MDSNSIRDTADAVKGIVEAVPVYQDVVQPAAKQLGQGLETIAKTINVALAPVGAMVWGYEKIREYLINGLAERFQKIPAERIVSPDPAIVGPAIEALRFAGHDTTLRELYANLIATNMDRSTVLQAHPAFVEVLKQITPDEAKILPVLSRGQNFPILNVDKQIKVVSNGKEETRTSWVLRRFSLLPYIAGCTYPDLGPSYIENLERLRIGIIPWSGIGISGSTIGGEDAYKDLECHPVVIEARARIDATPGEVSELDHSVFRVSAFGRQFLNAVISKT